MYLIIRQIIFHSTQGLIQRRVKDGRRGNATAWSLAEPVQTPSPKAPSHHSLGFLYIKTGGRVGGGQATQKKHGSDPVEKYFGF